MKKIITKKEKVFLIASLLILSLLLALSAAKIIFFQSSRTMIPYNIFEILGTVPTFILVLICACRAVTDKSLPIQKKGVAQFSAFATILLSSFAAAHDLRVMLIPFSVRLIDLPTCVLFTAFFAVLFYCIKTRSGKPALFITAGICIICEIICFFEFGFYMDLKEFNFDLTRSAAVIFWCAAALFFPKLFQRKKINQKSKKNSG